MIHLKNTTLLCVLWCCVGALSIAAPQGSKSSIPDFTKGDTIPEAARHDWNLGPTGLRGWMYCDKLVTTDARQIAITAVEKGSPAEGIIEVGDVILGIREKKFSYDPRTEFGKAITAAETDAGKGDLHLIRWRSGQEEKVILRLPVLGSYGDNAPYDCLKSQRILVNGVGNLYERMARADYVSGVEPIPRSLNALALLAYGDPKHAVLLQREARWAADFETADFRTWYYGYVMIFLAEYSMKTGDASVLPGLRRLALQAAQGQSAVGSWGHTFALPDGRLRGYGMMNAPGLPLTIGMVLARDAGVKDPEVSHAIDLSSRLLRFYTGKGAVPYGDHPAWIETHEDNGKCGMAATLFHLLGEVENADFFTRMSIASHSGERDCGHTGNFFNILWSLPAIALAGPHATGAWNREFGGWYHDLARRWDGAFTHQGPPEPDLDSYHGWDATGAYLLAYTLPLKKITLTGRKPSLLAPFSTETTSRLIADGRGWDNKDRKSFYQKLDESELLLRLASWSPVVRERAALEFASRKKPPTEAITLLLDSENLNARIGACTALEKLRGGAASSVPKLQETLQHENLWLRVRAAAALAAIGRPAMRALPDMLDRIAQKPSSEDPRGMEQRYVSSSIFGNLLSHSKSLEGVDRDKLRLAIMQGLQNQDGHARSEISEIYRNLSFEELEPLFPSILEAIEKPSPSGEMFADGVRLNGLKVLAAHQMEEGIQACADYIRTQNPWASEHRTPEILGVLLLYGAHAQRVIPHLEETADSFDRGEVDFPKQLSRQKAKALREAIKKIEDAEVRSPLKRIK